MNELKSAKLAVRAVSSIEARVYSALSSVETPSTGGPGTLGDIARLLRIDTFMGKKMVRNALNNLRKDGKVHCNGKTWSRT